MLSAYILCYIKQYILENKEEVVGSSGKSSRWKRTFPFTSAPDENVVLGPIVHMFEDI